MKSSRTGWGLLAPTLIILAITGLLPFLYVIYIGFFDWNIFSAKVGKVFAAGNNYRRLVFDKDFLGSLAKTLVFAGWAVTSEFVIGYFLARTLSRNFPGKAFFRTIHTLPLMIAPIAVGATWRLLTIPGFGPVPFNLEKWFHFSYNIGRYGGHALVTIILMDIWHWTPFVTLTLLAGLSSLPVEPFESAVVDGANRRQIFWYITIPGMMPVILTTFFIRMMDALRVVDEVWMLTGGGPGSATRVVGIHIWRIVFPKTDYGYGSAMSLLTLYFTIVLSWLVYTAIAARRRQSVL